MERKEALVLLKGLIGKDLRKLAEEHKVTVFKSKKSKDEILTVGEKESVEVVRLNKGWAGHTCERFLNLPLNSSQSPNFGSWELKQISVKHRKDNVLVLKETMQITMIDPVDVKAKSFKESHLYSKLKKMIVVARITVDKKESTAIVHSVHQFDLDNPEVLAQVEKDYEEVRAVLKEKGLDGLSGKMGKLVQPRTKGPGHGSNSRAFYARKELLSVITGIPHPAPKKKKKTK